MKVLKYYIHNSLSNRLKIEKQCNAIYKLGLFGILKLALALQFLLMNFQCCTNAYFSVACNTKVTILKSKLLQKLFREVLTVLEIAIDSTPRGKSNSIQDKKINCGQCNTSTPSNPNTLLILQTYLSTFLLIFLDSEMVCTYVFTKSY